MSSIINKVKDAVHPDKHHSQPEGTAGPHGSRVANAADPRVDSDRDHRGNPASSVGTGHSASAYGPTGTTGSYGTTGPHDSNVGNKLDPRVDSDRDHRANPASSAGTGLTGTHGTTGAYGTTGSSGLTGTHGNTGAYGTTGSSGLTGTHGSSHVTGYNDPEGTHGPHSSRVANAADPRIDSDRDHRGVGNTYGGGATGTSGLGGTGPGPAANTAGPHKSDVLNKADPRVDSDLDGSKTFGQDKTYRS